MNPEDNGAGIACFAKQNALTRFYDRKALPILTFCAILFNV